MKNLLIDFLELIWALIEFVLRFIVILVFMLGLGIAMPIVFTIKIYKKYGKVKKKTTENTNG